MISERQSWELAFDTSHAAAVKLTFGNLVKSVLKVDEFVDLEVELNAIKTVRDYFAHRFMRDEAHHAGSDDGCWLLLAKIAVVRRKTLALENALRPRFQQCIGSVGRILHEPSPVRVFRLRLVLDRDALVNPAKHSTFPPGKAICLARVTAYFVFPQLLGKCLHIPFI